MTCLRQTKRCDFAPRAFTLVEILIVVVIIGILAGLVFPKYRALSREARAKSQATSTRQVRELVQVHANSGQYDLAASGWPDDIHSEWFKGGNLPANSWTALPMEVAVVAGGEDNVYPATKTFDTEIPGSANAWYNTDNGAFCSLVPVMTTDAETLMLFNIANATDCDDLGQTQH